MLYRLPVLRRLLLGLLLVLLLVGPARAQPEALNWKFGSQAGLSFPAGGSGGPGVQPAGSSMNAYEGCASISDADGVLQCYSNGLEVWDRTGQRMPSGQLQGSDLSASQAALLLRGPSQRRFYYLFNIGAEGTASFGVVRQTIVDMSLRGGLGDVGSVNSRALLIPGGGLVTEKLTAVRHANGRDYWVVVHGWENNNFYSYLLSPSGLTSSPVVSAVGAVHQGSGTGGSNSIGYLRASPDGRRLAAAQVSTGVELFDFDAATGRVSAPQPVPRVSEFSYSLEFSPDNSKLYLTDGSAVYQLNLAANLAVTRLPAAGGPTMGLQRGPDNQIYVSILGTGSLAVIRRPNAAGLACGLEPAAQPLNGGVAQLGLPNFPNAFATDVVLPPPAPLPAPVIGPVAQACAGILLTFSAAAPAPAGGVFTWNFGDPASGADNTATGSVVTHRYAAGGAYRVSLTLTTPDGTATAAPLTVQVGAAPVFSLGARQQFLCAGQTLVLGAGAQPAGSSYRWQDGSVGTSYTVRTPGRYGLRLTSPQGCVSRDSVEVLPLSPPVVRLGRDTLLCPDAFLTLQTNPQPAGSTYRWSDGSTAPTLQVGQPGQYFVEVRSPDGCVARAAQLVAAGSAATGCPVAIIPNIITPNGDPQNQFFAPQGLPAGDWALLIFNRWGRQVFQQARYDYRWSAAGQPAGPYYYVLHNARSGQRHQGWVEVVR